MKKYLLLLTSLLTLSSFTYVQAIDLLEIEEQGLVELNNSFYSQLFLNFNPETKVYTLAANYELNEKFIQVSEGKATEEVINEVDSIKENIFDLHQSFISNNGNGYTHRMINIKSSNEIFFEFKDGSVIIELDVLPNTNLTADEAPTEGDVSREFRNALDKAYSYLDYMPFSQEGLYDQLLYEKFPEDAAQYAVDNVQTDWNQNALNKAYDYLDYMSFSNSGLYDQLIYEGFTPEQAQYAIDNLD